MTTEQLLKPRYKVIADYPGAILEVGQIIKTYESAMTYVTESEKACLKDYPHLFQPLPWYKERAPEDMPEYVKHVNGGVYKVIEHNVGGASLEGSYYAVYKNLQPATLEEYNEWKQSNK